jgi:hypothetical protein
MTFEQCHANLAAIRRKQGTPCPVVRVASNGVVYSGRLKRADSDLASRPGPGAGSPFGVLVLENLGLARGPETILQIASIPEGGILDLQPAH